ncbi:MAG: rhodanese-like domain-containing protein, partial [Cetobacterium sp.]
MIIIKYEDLLKEKNYTLIDVRTPKEFEEEGIPGAINIPLLLDDERIDVGTAYKQVSPEKAKELGVEAIAKRLPDIFREVQ